MDQNELPLVQVEFFQHDGTDYSRKILVLRFYDTGAALTKIAIRHAATEHKHDQLLEVHHKEGLVYELSQGWRKKWAGFWKWNRARRLDSFRATLSQLEKDKEHQLIVQISQKAGEKAGLYIQNPDRTFRIVSDSEMDLLVAQVASSSKKTWMFISEHADPLQIKGLRAIGRMM